jgi:lysophospholipase L1-like esterase
MKVRAVAKWVLGSVLVPLGIAVFLLLDLEGGCRVAGRVKSGTWPLTRAEAYTRFVQQIGGAYRLHPFLVVCGRPGGVIQVPGHDVRLNALGMRGPEVRMPKPPGTFRVLCEGGSTTFDLLAASNAGAWPERLAAKLGAGSDVVNAGFPGWTSLESLVSLEIRDADLAPDLVVVYSGINDLQPAGHVPFTPDYSKGHADLLPRVLGATPIPIRLVSRSLLIEKLRDRIHAREKQPVEGFTPAWDWKGGPRRGDIPPEAVDVYERNLRSTIGVAHANGARTLLVAMAVRLRKGKEDADREYLASWTPGLTAEGYAAGLARYNVVARKLGEEGVALFFDPFASSSFADVDYGDPTHFSSSGSEKFASSMATEIARIRSANPAGAAANIDPEPAVHAPAHRQ